MHPIIVCISSLSILIILVSSSIFPYLVIALGRKTNLEQDVVGVLVVHNQMPVLLVKLIEVLVEHPVHNFDLSSSNDQWKAVPLDQLIEDMLSFRLLALSSGCLNFRLQLFFKLGFGSLKELLLCVVLVAIDLNLGDQLPVRLLGVHSLENLAEAALVELLFDHVPIMKHNVVQISSRLLFWRVPSLPPVFLLAFIILLNDLAIAIA